MQAGVVVLAAGAGSRFGGAKQRLLLPLVLARLRGRAPVVVVGGAHAIDVPAPVRQVRAGEWRHGPGASLRAGLAALGDCEAAVVVLADGPLLAPESIDRVLAAWRIHGGIVAASYGGVRGHPVVIGRDRWQDIPDDGGRSLPAMLVPCDDLGSPGDVDTPQDLEQLGLSADN